MNKIQKIILFLSIIGLLISGIALAGYWWRGRTEELVFEALPKEQIVSTWQKSVDKEYKSVTVENIEEVDKEVLSKDCIGWLSIEDTQIDYPVMQNKEVPEYYLKRDYYGNPSRSGTPFLDAACDLEDEYGSLIIYGHHMNNQTMFSDLMQYRSAAYYEQHPIIQLETKQGMQLYQVFAILDTQTGEDEYGLLDHIQLDEESEYQSFTNKLIEDTLYTTGKVPVFGERLLFLVTCSSTKVQSGRWIVAAYEIKH